MEIILNHYPIIIYAALFSSIKFSEHQVLTRPAKSIRKGWGDWTVWLIMVPLWLAFLGPVLEYFVLGRWPSLLEMSAGAVLFVMAGLFSIKGYLDLQKGFTDALEIEETNLVVTGLYHTIRHPISLGNMLFCIACPVFLAAGPSWIPALVAIFGVILRISIEESYMKQHLSDYQDYKERTWALIPFIY